MKDCIRMLANLFDIRVTERRKMSPKKKTHEGRQTHSKRRPIRRLASNTVLRGFMAAWFLAASPIKRSSFEKATYDGVVRLPSGYSVAWSQKSVESPDKILTVIGNNLDPIVLPDANTSVSENVDHWPTLSNRTTYEYVVPRSIPIAPSNKSSIFYSSWRRESK